MSRRSIEELEQVAARAGHGNTDRQLWETLRELAVGRMEDARLPTEMRLRWAHLALAAIQRKTEASETDRKAALTDEAYVRVNAIRSFGATQDRGLRDPADLCEAVFREIGRTPDELRTDAVHWRTLPRQEVLQLRRVKNLLTPLRCVEGLFPMSDPLHGKLSAWLSLIPDLP